jgi:hypothetical protein
LTKFGEKLKVLKWMVGGERKFEASEWDCCIALLAIGVDWLRLLQSKPFKRKIGECTSNWKNSIIEFKTVLNDGCYF